MFCGKLQAIIKELFGIYTTTIGEVSSIWDGRKLMRRIK